MRRSGWAVVVVFVVACAKSPASGPQVPRSSVLTPDSDCGEQVEPVAGLEPNALVGSCHDGKTCTELRWQAEADPSSAIQEACERRNGVWSVGACPKESAVGACRTFLFYERCRSMTTTWVLEADALESAQKRCTEVSGEMIAVAGPAPFTPEPDSPETQPAPAR